MLPAAPADETPAFVPRAVTDKSATGAEAEAVNGGLEIILGQITSRLPADTDVARIAAVAAALEARL